MIAGLPKSGTDTARHIRGGAVPWNAASAAPPEDLEAPAL